MTNGKVINCRAAVAWKPKEPLSIEEIQVSPPKAGEVRIRIVSASLCHTDVNALYGFNKVDAFPRILGHEGAGIVESVGENVTEFKPGDHVIPLFNAQCNNCKFCLSRKTNMCFKLRHTEGRGVMPDGTTRFTCKGQQLYHFMGCSTFSEYTVVAEISVCKVNPSASLSRICLFGCGVSTGYGAALNTAKVEPGSTCAVFGLGAVGLSTGLGCAAAGAKRIIGIDINEAKFQIGKKFGFTDFVNPNNYDQPIQVILKEMTDGGLDYTFECIGNAQTMRAALESCHNGWGMSVIFGLPKTGEEISAKPMLLLTGRTWKGTLFGGWRSKDDVPKLVEKYLNREIILDDFVTAELPLDKINEGFELLQAGDGIRTVVNF